MAGPPAGAQTALTELTFGILTPTASEWPVYIAQAQGFYKDEGLNVTIVEGNTPPNVINMVATNGANLVDNGCDSEGKKAAKCGTGVHLFGLLGVCVDPRVPETPRTRMRGL